MASSFINLDLDLLKLFTNDVLGLAGASVTPHATTEIGLIEA
jgi:hypothetical protein